MTELLACVGLMWIIKDGSIFATPRKTLQRVPVLDRLLKCSLCLGLWVGVLAAVVLFFQGRDWLWIPFASAAVCWLFDSIMDLIQVAAHRLDDS